MNIIVALILGLLIGWLIEWVIDWFYWRRPRPEPAPDAAVIPAPAPVIVAPKKERDLTPSANPDDLTVIKGIGPVIAKKLNQAGIYTYEQLAELSQDEFEHAMGNLLERFINERSILRQARELDREKKVG